MSSSMPADLVIENRSPDEGAELKVREAHQFLVERTKSSTFAEAVVKHFEEQLHKRSIKVILENKCSNAKALSLGGEAVEINLWLDSPSLLPPSETFVHVDVERLGYHECHTGPDVGSSASRIFLCIEAISRTAKRMYLPYDALLKFVYYHELAHRLMAVCPQPEAEQTLCREWWYEVFEEGLANLFALKCSELAGGDTKVLIDRFVRHQPLAYKACLVLKDCLNQSRILLEDVLRAEYDENSLALLWYSSKSIFINVELRRQNMEKVSSDLKLDWQQEDFIRRRAEGAGRYALWQTIAKDALRRLRDLGLTLQPPLVAL